MRLAVLTVRNEGAFLLEWLAHHRAVGFDRFLVFSNDCEDGTELMLDRLAELGWLTHVPNPAPHEGGVQWAALKRADGHPLVAAAEWILPLDVDEFVNVHAGDGSVDALLAAVPGAGAVALTWRLFGNGGVVQFQDAPVTDQFTRAAPRDLTWPWRAHLFKTLHRAGGYRRLGVHRPQDLLDPAVLWVDGNGAPLPPAFRTGRIFTPPGRSHHGLVQLNHYPLGAMESYLLKVARGRAVHGGERLGLDYWAERNWAAEEDRSIARYAPARDRLLAELRADAGLDRLHRAAVAWRHLRLAELMREEPVRALMARLMLTPPAQPLSAPAAAYLARFSRPPE